MNEAPRDRLPEVAFLGRSNVGKSSVINSLLGSKLARTSATPGRTQLINFFLVNESFYFVDCPGYGYARVPENLRRQWQALMEEYFKQREFLKLIVLLLDCRVAPTALDQRMWKQLAACRKPLTLVLTKIDKLSSRELQEAHQRVLQWSHQTAIVHYSAIHDSGRQQLWRVIHSAVESDPTSSQIAKELGSRKSGF